MTKRKWNQVLNLGSFANLPERRRKSRKVHYSSGENLDHENDLPHGPYDLWTHIEKDLMDVKQLGQLKSTGATVSFLPPSWLIWRSEEPSLVGILCWQIYAIIIRLSIPLHHII